MMMKTMFKNVTVMAMACVVGLMGQANADEMDADNTILFAGGDVREKADFAYAGFIHHFSGDLLSDGILVRGLVGHSNYEYNTITNEIDARANSFELMIGYQKVMESFSARTYIGLDYSNHKLSPDNIFDENRGSDTGIKVQAELETDFASPNYGALIVNYGSAKESYWARLRAGHEFSGVVIGPEVILLGDQTYNEQRFGAFLTVKKLIPVMLSVSAGYADPDSARGGSSAYLALEISRTF